MGSYLITLNEKDNTMDFPGRVFHREFGPRLVHSIEEIAELVMHYGLGWHSDPVAAARGEHEVLDVISELLGHKDPGPMPPNAAVISELAPKTLFDGVTDAELEALTAPASQAPTSDEPATGVAGE